jgi:hypothetical protein
MPCQQGVQYAKSFFYVLPLWERQTVVPEDTQAIFRNGFVTPTKFDLVLLAKASSYTKYNHFHSLLVAQRTMIIQNDTGEWALAE